MSSNKTVKAVCSFTMSRPLADTRTIKAGLEGSTLSEHLSRVVDSTLATKGSMGVPISFIKAT